MLPVWNDCFDNIWIFKVLLRFDWRDNCSNPLELALWEPEGVPCRSDHSWFDFGLITLDIDDYLILPKPKNF